MYTVQGASVCVCVSVKSQKKNKAMKYIVEVRNVWFALFGFMSSSLQTVVVLI